MGGTTDYLDLSYNRYTFNGLECINADNFFYVIAPQASIPVHTYQNGLAISAGGTLSNNTYKWFKVGAAGSRTIVGDSTITPNQSGSYYAKVTNKATPTLTLYTDTVTYTKTAGLSNINITLSPNPTRGLLTVHGLDESEDALVRITDETGHVWLQAMSRHQSVLRLNTNVLKPGHYYVVLSNNADVKTVGFVKE